DLQRESKENQWLGVSVKSQGPGGKIVVSTGMRPGDGGDRSLSPPDPHPPHVQTCAHLYETRNRVRQPLETRDVIGRCYVLSQDLRVRDELDGGEWKFCEGRPQGHDRFGFCQQGLAAGFTADSRYILFGAPGTYNWKGNMRVEVFNHSSLDLVHYDDGPYEAGGEKDQDPSLIPVPANSYLGFSVDSARGLTRRHELSFVAGAPRANHTGAVVILRRDSAHRLVPEAVLPGEQLTSAFGYALAVLDLNGDGCAGGGDARGQQHGEGATGLTSPPPLPRSWMDLAVGAPHFFERHEEIGGAAYVYINPGGHWAAATPLRLNGTYGSMFGVALSAAGDLDQDGFSGEGSTKGGTGGLRVSHVDGTVPLSPPDLAVGAPFDGAGKVYIYHGSKLGIVAKPAQVTM
ncbi:ITA7 protein, partial [Crypturellus undulatus]|nr:ITA7 protein [Crypturellus undulatus]